MRKIRFFIAIPYFLFTVLYSQGTVEGRITDEAGLSVSGANIYIKNSDKFF